MAALDWSQCPAVESVHGKVRGASGFKGTPVAAVIENVKDLSTDEVDFVAKSLRGSRQTPNAAGFIATSQIHR